MPCRSEPSQLAQLTRRERDVFDHMARGFSNQEIARDLVVEESTVRTHVKRILMKLHLRDQIQVVVHAYETGVVQPASSTASHGP